MYGYTAVSYLQERKAEDSVLLAYEVVAVGYRIPTFRVNLVASSSKVGWS